MFCKRLRHIEGIDPLKTLSYSNVVLHLRANPRRVPLIEAT
jgi:hypothetical protein